MNRSQFKSVRPSSWCPPFLYPFTPLFFLVLQNNLLENTAQTHHCSRILSSSHLPIESINQSISLKHISIFKACLPFIFSSLSPSRRGCPPGTSFFLHADPLPSVTRLFPLAEMCFFLTALLESLPSLKGHL